MNIVDIQGVTKLYSEFVALDDVTLSVPQGCVFGLLGPNGAGKTTLIRILMRISFPDKGQILFKGHPLSGDDVYDMGYLPEERGLYKKMKTGEQAMYLARLKGLDRQIAYERLREKFEQYGINEWWNKPVEELSKGMQQKVQFITTILHKPSFLILDEPFSGFDPINTNLLKDEIMQLKKEGTTIVLSTHNMASVEEICDQIALINRSRKILEGDIFEVKNRFKKNLFSIETAHCSDALVHQIQEQQYQICAQQTNDYYTRFEIKIPEGRTSNDLLGLFMQYGDIHAFNEIMPTMNEIFIEQVERANQQQSHEE
ncbi:MAG: ATP-binding cassette domain-containing protein [Bacteroidales bacterium]|jgi:ABC-2 type transport system ATP-binding protein|nr:ATP-binding cassette domain-containing protein [Bacteroidales bacterium]